MVGKIGSLDTDPDGVLLNEVADEIAATGKTWGDTSVLTKFHKKGLWF